MAYSSERGKATAIRNAEFLDLMSYYKFSRERPCTMSWVVKRYVICVAKSVHLTLTFPMRVLESYYPDGRFLKIALKRPITIKQCIPRSLGTNAQGFYWANLFPHFYQIPTYNKIQFFILACQIFHVQLFWI